MKRRPNPHVPARQEAIINQPLQGPADDLDHFGGRLQITYRPIDELKLDPRNPRRHSTRKLRQLARSLETFGFVAPALIDQDDRVIAGNARILAARELGWSEIPTIRLEHLSEAKRRALMIADNRLAECASWDKRLLAEQLNDLSMAELDFNIEVTGFEIGEIDLKIEGLETVPAEDPADATGELGPAPSISRDGDLWFVGEHRVLCGNVFDRTALERLMRDELAAMIFTDPACDGTTIGLGRIHHRCFGTGSAEQSSAGCGLLALSLDNQAAFCRGGALLYICMGWRWIPELFGPGRYAGATLEGLCIWVKDNAGTGPLYPSQHEPIFVFRTADDCADGNVRLARPDRDRSDVWRYPAVKPSSRKGRKKGVLEPHEAAKPVALVEDAILDGSARGDIVLDGFLGRGTTLIAAERTGRRCFGIEQDPAAVDGIVRRWQKLTGGTARHAGTGASFDDLLRAAEVADAA